MKFKNTFLTKQALYMPWNRLVTIMLSLKKKTRQKANCKSKRVKRTGGNKRFTSEIYSQKL